jgi:hypothetical protein
MLVPDVLEFVPVPLRFDPVAVTPALVFTFPSKAFASSVQSPLTSVGPASEALNQ